MASRSCETMAAGNSRMPDQSGPRCCWLREAFKTDFLSASKAVVRFSRAVMEHMSRKVAIQSLFNAEKAAGLRQPFRGGTGL